jgi:hypothetical protein
MSLSLNIPGGNSKIRMHELVSFSYLRGHQSSRKRLNVQPGHRNKS